MNPIPNKHEHSIIIEIIVLMEKCSHHSSHIYVIEILNLFVNIFNNINLKDIFILVYFCFGSEVKIKKKIKNNELKQHQLQYVFAGKPTSIDSVWCGRSYKTTLEIDVKLFDLTRTNS